jgi:hypothetical protein
MAGYRPPYNRHIVRIPLLKWLQINRNATAIGYVPINKAIDNDTFISAIEHVESFRIGIDSFRLPWTRFLSLKTPETVYRQSPFSIVSKLMAPLVPATAATTSPPTCDDDDDERTWWQRIIQRIPLFPEFAKFFIGATDESAENNSSRRRVDYTLTCTEVIVFALQHAGVVSREVTACSYLPSAIPKLEIPTINGFAYEKLELVSIKNVVESTKL